MREPSVRRNGRGVWETRVYLGTDARGRQVRKYKSFPEARSEEEARRMAADWARTVSWQARHHTSERLADVLARYMAANPRRLSDSTLDAYGTALRRYVAPLLGDAAVGDISASDIDELYNDLALGGRIDGGPLSGSTVRLVHHFLCGAWDWMAKERIVEADILDGVKAPRPSDYEAIVFSSGELQRLSAALSRMMADTSCDYAAIMRRTAATAAYIALWTGARIGEVCALRRCDIDLGRRTIDINGSMCEAASTLKRGPTKSRSGNRRITMGKNLADALRAHMEWVDGYAGRACGRSCPLLCRKPGVFLRPSAVSREFSRLRDELDLPREATFHSLRHTHATYLIEIGTNPRTVSERLGHSKTSTTMEIYAHSIALADRQAVDALWETAKEAGWASGL